MARCTGFMLHAHGALCTASSLLSFDTALVAGTCISSGHFAAASDVVVVSPTLHTSFITIHKNMGFISSEHIPHFCLAFAASNFVGTVVGTGTVLRGDSCAGCCVSRAVTYPMCCADCGACILVGATARLFAVSGLHSFCILALQQ